MNRHRNHCNKSCCSRCNVSYCCDCNTSCPLYYSLTGATGLMGATGMIGDQGQPGLNANTGILGATGMQGIIGLSGNNGLPGETGIQGNTGMMGLIGATGLSQSPCGFQGPTGMTSNIVYGSIYSNSTNSQTVVTGASISFNNVGPLSGITFNGNDGLILPVTGNYEALYTVLTLTISGNTGMQGSTGITPSNNSILLSKNNTYMVNSIYGNNGAEIFGTVEFTANAGDIIRLLNNGLTFTLNNSSYIDVNTVNVASLAIKLL